MTEITYWAWRYRASISKPSVLHGSWWLAASPDCFTLGNRAPGTQRIGVWVGPRAGLDTVAK
jgi:hypothetical protein